MFGLFVVNVVSVCVFVYVCGMRGVCVVCMRCACEYSVYVLHVP